jgi:tRNA(Ile)-lysidine synthase
VRHELVPLLESVHPGARAGVARLSRHAEGVAALLDHVMAPLLGDVVIERGEGSIVLDRDRFLGRAAVEQREILRRLCESLGLTPSESGTATTLQFMTSGQSGGQIQLPAGLRLTRSFDRFILGPAEQAGPSTEIEIDSLDDGRGELVCSGRRYEARWGREKAIDDQRSEASGWQWASLAKSELSLPLVLRGWHEGDRTRTRGGGKKLKKLFGEVRLPRGNRAQVPILVDREGVALWIPGMHQVPGPAEGERWNVGVRDRGDV